MVIVNIQIQWYTSIPRCWTQPYYQLCFHQTIYKSSNRQSFAKLHKIHRPITPTSSNISISVGFNHFQPLFGAEQIGIPCGFRGWKFLTCPVASQPSLAPFRTLGKLEEFTYLKFDKWIITPSKSGILTGLFHLVNIQKAIENGHL